MVEGRRELLQHYLWVSLSKSYTWQHLPFVEHNLKYTLNEIFYDLLVSKLSALISQDLANGSFKCYFTEDIQLGFDRVTCNQCGEKIFLPHLLLEPNFQTSIMQ